MKKKQNVGKQKNEPQFMILLAGISYVELILCGLVAERAHLCALHASVGFLRSTCTLDAGRKEKMLWLGISNLNITHSQE